MARFLLLALALVGCGKVTDPDAVDGSIHGDGTGLDAHVGVTKPVAKLASVAIAGAGATCAIGTASTGPGTITYVTSWSINGFPFTSATTTTLPNDTLPPSITHTGDVVACSLFASNGIDGALSDPARATMGARTAFLAARDLSAPNPSNGTLLSIDLDTLQVVTIGTFGVGFAFGDLAWDAKNQVLYMVDGQSAKTLYTVDITTGKATAVGVHGLTDMRGLAIDPTTGRLFGDLGLASPALVVLNTTSGAATGIGGTTALDGLVFDTKRALMMGLVAGGSAAVVTVDETSGKTSGAHIIAGGPNGVENSGMTYDAFTDKLVAIDEVGTVVEIDPANNYSSFARTTLATTGIDGVAIKLPKPE